MPPRALADEGVVTGRPRVCSDARQLLADLIRPQKRTIGFVLVAALVQVVATMAAPLVSGWLRSVFVLRSGRIGQDVFDLRRRGYDHIQALSLSFHERFTSGR